jgi:hypothetical protein
MAREFRDDQGRPWTVALTCEAAKRVKGLVTVVNEEGATVPFDLVDTATINQTITVLRSQYLTIGETLCAILSRQIEDRGLTREQFLEGLRGDALDDAAKAVEEELINFFPKRLRRMIGLIASKMDEVSTTMMAKAEAQLEAVTVESLLASGAPSTKLPESLDAIPATGLTES